MRLACPTYLTYRTTATASTAHVADLSSKSGQNHFDRPFRQDGSSNLRLVRFYRTQSSQDTEEERIIQFHLSEAVDRLDRDDLALALVSYESVLRQQPKNIDALTGKAGMRPFLVFAAYFCSFTYSLPAASASLQGVLGSIPNDN
jgi:hypothetical protein